MGRIDQPDDRPGQGGLAGTRFADQGQHLAGPDLEIEIGDCRDLWLRPARGLERDGQGGYLKQ